MDPLIHGLMIALGAGVLLYVVPLFFRTTLLALPAFAAGMVACLVVVPLVALLGNYLGREDALNYNEYYNGYETAADMRVIDCYRDGACVHEYQCDSYQHTGTRTEYYTDSQGNRVSRQVPYSETRYHQCPYATQEVSYVIRTTLGDRSMGSHRFTENPQPWRMMRSLPGHVSQGPPSEWVEARTALEAGEPRGVTKVFSYDNYILATQSKGLAQNAGLIESYLSHGMLPKPVSGDKGMWADKAYAVNRTLDPEWQDAMMQFNAALGSDLRGDLHLVVVDGVQSPDDYTSALESYWQSPELGKNALSKNAIVLVLGTNNKDDMVLWSRAFTGMPTGNEDLLEVLATSFEGEDLDPETILGTPRGRVVGDEVEVITGSAGILTSALWGDPGFVRQCMVCEDEGTLAAGYSNLRGEVQPSPTAKVITLVVVLLLSGGIWTGIVLAWPRP